MHKDAKSDQQLELVLSIQVVCAKCVYNCSLPCLILRVTVGGNHFPIVGLYAVKRVQCVSVYHSPGRSKVVLLLHRSVVASIGREGEDNNGGVGNEECQFIHK